MEYTDALSRAHRCWTASAAQCSQIPRLSENLCAILIDLVNDHDQTTKKSLETGGDISNLKRYTCNVAPWLWH